MKIYLVIVFAASFLILQGQIISTSFANPPKKSITKKAKECFETLDHFASNLQPKPSQPFKKARSWTKGITWTTKQNLAWAIERFKNVNLYMRKKILEVLLSFRKESQDAHESYATLLNKMYQKKLITKTQIDSLISYEKNTMNYRYYLLWVDESVVVRSRLEDFFPDSKYIKEDILEKLHVPIEHKPVFTEMLNSITLSRSQWSVVKRSIQMPDFSEQTIERFHAYLRFTQLKPNEHRQRVLQGLGNLYNTNNYYLPFISRFFSYLRFAAGTNNAPEKTKILDAIGVFFKTAKEELSATSEVKSIRLFNKLDHQRREFWEKQTKALKVKIQKTMPDYPPEKVEQMAQKTAYRMTKKLEQLQYSCRANNLNPSQKRAVKDTAIVFTAAGTASMASSYTWKNAKNWEKDGPKLWMGKLLYDLVTAATMNYLFTTFIKPKGKYMNRFYGGYSFLAMVDLVNSYIYGLFFGVNDEKVQIEFEKLRNSPEFLRDFGDIMSQVEHHRAKLLPQIFSKYKDALPKFIKDKKEVEWDQLTPDDLDQEKIRKKLLEILAIKMYEDQDVNFRSGYFEVDRWGYHRMFDLVLLKGIGIGLLIHRTLCMQGMRRTKSLIGESNRTWAYAMALSLFIVDRAINDSVYYITRPEFIGL
ncbi:MAG: hypothetical protein ISR65_03270 [Bacteriovoracaceae bacterium]|nr:hypothetical protein [Bacteriovoracaceae bacterium]